jgi:hypothetical protein
MEHPHSNGRKAHCIERRKINGLSSHQTNKAQCCLCHQVGAKRVEFAVAEEIRFCSGELTVICLPWVYAIPSGALHVPADSPRAAESAFKKEGRVQSGAMTGVEPAHTSPAGSVTTNGEGDRELHGTALESGEGWSNEVKLEVVGWSGLDNASPRGGAHLVGGTAVYPVQATPV